MIVVMKCVMINFMVVLMLDVMVACMAYIDGMTYVMPEFRIDL